MKTEAWLKRKIELKQQLVSITLEEIGDLNRELLTIQGKDVNGHGRSLNCAPIYDPFLNDLERELAGIRIRQGLGLLSPNEAETAKINAVNGIRDKEGLRPLLVDGK